MGRLRFNNKAQEFIDLDKEYIINQINKNIFDNSNKEIHIEIGCGKGDFILNKSLQNPNINYIGIEKYSSVIAIALKKLKNYKLNNVKLLNLDAKDLLEFFKDIKVNKIYLNFSDPWPKKRHTNRRLTSDNFLKIYKEILVPNSIIEFKTDNDSLFEFSLENLKLENIKNEIIYFCDDIYSELNNEYNKDNVQTEYEKKFIGLNKKIKKITFKFK